MGTVVGDRGQKMTREGSGFCSQSEPAGFRPDDAQAASVLQTDIWQPACNFIVEQDRDIIVKSGRPPLRIKRIERWKRRRNGTAIVAQRATLEAHVEFRLSKTSASVRSRKLSGIAGQGRTLANRPTATHTLKQLLVQYPSKTGDLERCWQRYRRGFWPVNRSENGANFAPLSPSTLARIVVCP